VSAERLAYRQLLAYIDKLNESVSQLAVAIERKMKEHGYVPISNAEKKGFWSLRSDIDTPRAWRLKMLTRMLVPAGCTLTDHSLLYQILIDSTSAFDFPTILCARVEHPSMTPAEVFGPHVWMSGRIVTLQHKTPTWTNIAEENGWCVAEPAYRSRIKRVKGYILNLFDVTTLQLVSEKIVEPLLHSGDDDWPLTVEHLPFGGLSER
jgi:hypothetical protein